MAQGEAWACGADCARVFAGQRGGSIALKQLGPALVGRRWRDEAFAPHYASKGTGPTWSHRPGVAKSLPKL